MNISQYIDLIEDPRLRKSCQKILDAPEFFTHPASTGIHHGYVGGLAIHTLEVLDYAVAFSKSFPQTDFDVLITAGLWHDYAKIFDYKLVTFYKHQYNELPKHYVLASEAGPTGIYETKSDPEDSWKTVYVADTEYKNKIHHVTGSTAEFAAAAIIAGVDRKTIDKVAHAIIAHHGRKDWGSIKEPQTLEAWLLHSADYASAHFGARKNKQNENFTLNKKQTKALRPQEEIHLP